MDVGLMVTSFGDVDLADVAARAEEQGYDAVWVGELWGASGVVQATEMACRTDEIGIGTAILNVYSRSPAVLAMTAASLADASDGRFTLGLGTSTAKAVEDLHGTAFDRPVRRAHETIELVREFTAGTGEPVAYDGELLEARDFPSIGASFPIYHAGLGPANRRVVGRLCDGWIPHNIPFSRLEEAFEEVAAAARERERDPDEITIAPYVPSAVSEDPEAARETLRRHVAYYVGSGEGYRRAVATSYPDEADRIADAWRSGEKRDAASAVTDEMLADLGVAGTPEEARERLRSLVAETGIDHPIVVVPEPASNEVTETTIEALAPERA
ncbi:LLM class flavin-dependent oxidoreductase [Natrinema salaciae]|uniref:Flavin-dependent oxidoreductase, luciferase family (Includes alkanesulfonate monooxygenase SsuD and methylene tetrahydromethanopterin reductase) n=1 Tax=Natrinema salaciae TaxID=1186196 RepID=A0A1H9PZP1_9EURY|nr:LLM class flavin-dependent oxidoreductase [Natrinema salaciae]SER53620.1 Flavin-dependent oxidoreductase, luciferase family (includes alkanesulfonate monooxygenase SsuD and methylene tetrahydromethanopterin reductase) [Natrinema salaciae]